MTMTFGRSFPPARMDAGINHARPARNATIHLLFMFDIPKEKEVLPDPTPPPRHLYSEYNHSSKLLREKNGAESGREKGVSHEFAEKFSAGRHCRHARFGQDPKRFRRRGASAHG